MNYDLWALLINSVVIGKRQLKNYAVVRSTNEFIQKLSENKLPIRVKFDVKTSGKGKTRRKYRGTDNRGAQAPRNAEYYGARVWEGVSPLHRRLQCMGSVASSYSGFEDGDPAANDFDTFYMKKNDAGYT